MYLEFTKMHGLGNDFMVVDLITQRAYLDISRKSPQNRLWHSIQPNQSRHVYWQLSLPFDDSPAAIQI